VTTPLLERPWKAARIAAVSLALSAAAFSTAGSLPSGTASATGTVTTTPAGPAAAPCLSAASGQRVRAESGLDGVDPNDLTLAQTRQVEAKVASRTRQRGLGTQRSSLPSTKVDVYVHVITRDSGSGGVSRKRIKKQISVLNKAYAGKASDSSTKTGFSFALKAVDKTKNSDWYDWSPDPSGHDDVRAKTALHRGGPDDLNLYLAALKEDVLGYSSFPWDTSLAQDGVVVLNASLPDGKADGYNKGDTATHEVGHWLGLLHTFQNGCTSPGDLVDDTPSQDDGDNIFLCSSKLDTCAAQGKDPVHNYMSYGDDTCLNRFTKDQAQRMARAWALFRAPATAT
jgi:hypothetical protein